MIAREFNVDREEPPRLKTSTRDGGGIVRREVDPRVQQEVDDLDRPKVFNASSFHSTLSFLRSSSTCESSTVSCRLSCTRKATMWWRQQLKFVNKTRQHPADTDRKLKLNWNFFQIGDYILSPDIAVERKALDDLTQSLQSGRVFKQIEQVQRYLSEKLNNLLRCWSTTTARFSSSSPTESLKRRS